MIPKYLPGALLLLALPLLGQNGSNPNQEQYRLDLRRTQDPITIDGKLEEACWQQGPAAQEFWLKWPREGELALAQTRVMATYDDQYLYFAAVCTDDSAQYVIQSLKRDAEYWNSDGLAIVLDPMNLASNGYFFALTPAGVQYEALLATNAEMDFNWDQVWRSETQRQRGFWTAEFAIPLRILRFKPNQRHWGINFIRNDAGRGHFSTWAKVPLQFDGTDLGWTGTLQWDQPPAPAAGNYAIVPFVTWNGQQNAAPDRRVRSAIDFGADAKIGIGSALNLDLTLNPDFSQIEVDEQVINLTRFNIQLPEKRTFFLENADLFGNFGFPVTRPFFSRRIGLDPAGNPIPIIGGMRLTGNLGQKTRIGALSIQTRANEANPATNYAGLVFDRNLFGRSNLRGYGFNRQTFGQQDGQDGDYSRNYGGELTLLSTNGTWMGWLGHHQSLKPGVSRKDHWSQIGGMYTSKRLELIVDQVTMGDGYYADLGFENRLDNYDALRDTTLRIGYKMQYLEANWLSFPRNSENSLNSTTLSASSWLILNPDFSTNEYTATLGYSWLFKNTSELSIDGQYVVANVPVHFKFDDRPNAESPPLLPQHYRFGSLSLAWTSDTRQPFNLSASMSWGDFYNGQQYGAQLELRWRVQPWGSFRLAGNYSRLAFPRPYQDVNLLAITPRIEFFFNRNLFWTTFLQLNTQADNFNINSRLQWRFRPMSDLFVVYTDNYTALNWGSKNRALVVKLNYWL